MKNKVALITFARFPSEMAYGVHLVQIANSFRENNYGVNIYYPRTYNSKTIYTNPKDYYRVTNDIEFIEVNNIDITSFRIYDLMPNLRENIVEDFYLTPDYFENDLNTKHGSGFSIQPKFSQSAYFRFHNKSEIYDGLYFVGAGTHPGAGVPGVLSSAKVLDKIL